MLRRCLLLALVFVFSACTDDGMFASCPFSSNINQICSGGQDGAALTCVVETHPQCPEDICLAWKGTEPVCTKTCDPAAPDCPGGSSCQAFGATEGKFYCVEDSKL